MAHTVRDKSKLIARVRRLKGQMEAVERALDAEVPCSEVLRQLASIKGAVGGLTLELMEGHLRGHVMEAESDAERRHGGEQMLEVLRTYLK